MEKLFAGRYFDIPAANARMSGLMRDEGLPYCTRTMTYNSRLAQELAAWADSKYRGHSLHDALFQAYFVDGQNLGVEDVLLAAVAKTSLPVNEAQAVLTNRSFAEVVDADWRESRNLGITGVPTFTTGEQAAVGAQSYEVLEQLVISAGAIPRG